MRHEHEATLHTVPQSLKGTPKGAMSFHFHSKFLWLLKHPVDLGHFCIYIYIPMSFPMIEEVLATERFVP